MAPLLGYPRTGEQPLHRMYVSSSYWRCLQSTDVGHVETINSVRIMGGYGISDAR
jgi:hypothetical protein